MKKIAFLFPLLILFGCAPIDIEEFADDEKEAIATNYIQDIIDGRFEGIKEAIEPSLKPKLTDELLQQMSSVLGEEAPQSRELIGYNSHTFNQEPTRYNLSYQYGYPGRWVLVNIAFITLPNGGNEIFGLNVYNPMDQPLQEMHRFTLENKGAVHYGFLVACAIIPLFILTTLVVAIRTKFRRRKWLWIIFILFGLVQFSLNWTTGQIEWKFLNFQLFGAGALTASQYAPWILSFSVPIAAILFWIKREKLKRNEVQPDGTHNSGDCAPSA